MKVFNVTRYRVPALIASTLLIVGFWAYTIIVPGGFNFGIDLQAGLSMTVEFSQDMDEETLREALSEFSPQIQSAGSEGDTFLVRVGDDASVDDFQQVTTQGILNILEDEFSGARVISEEYFETSYAANLAVNTIWLTLGAMALILLYVWIRFKLNYAVSAVTAVFHDVLFLLGFIGAFQLEFSTATIAAVLTIIGYSLNDTIVIFDRVRENTRIVKDETFRQVINISISQSLSRTLITSVTTLLAVVAILVFATGSVQTFALSLAVGVLVGTYSSIFVASPILLAWHDRAAAKVHNAVSGKSSSSTAPAASRSSAKSAPEPVKQTAEEIAAATEKKAKAKAKKKKKK